MFDGPPPARRKPTAPAKPAAPSWTPEAVEAEMIEAARWLWITAGRAGPQGFVCSRFHDAPLSLAEHIEMFGDVPERADLDDERDEERDRERLHYRMLPARRIDQLEDALGWPARYVAPRRPDAARAVQCWIAARAVRTSFARLLRERGIPRQTAYRYRDRALREISVGLTLDRVPIR